MAEAITRKHVFISYAHTDEEFTSQLVSDLKANGITVWIDAVGLDPGTPDWKEAIRGAISQSFAVVWVATPASRQSRYVSGELALAEHFRCQVIPVWAGGSAWAECANIDMMSVQHIDCRGAAYSGGLQKLVSTLKDETLALNPKETLTPQDDECNLQRLFDRIDYWLQSLLDQLPESDFMLDVPLENRPDMVLNPLDHDSEPREQVLRPLPIHTKVIDIFDKVRHSLLILGEPGSGKTTIMRELARGLVKSRREHPEQPVPVIFNLSTWSGDDKDLAVWMVNELQTLYQVPPSYALRWLEKERLLLLLDGLDEVQAEMRDSCVQAINDYRLRHSFTDAVVCCRTREYAALSHKLNLLGAVLLRPLTLDQIDRYLEQFEDAVVSLSQAIHTDMQLQELAQSPLILNIMCLAYRNVTIQDLPTFSTIEEHRKYLFDTYIRRMFEHRMKSEVNHYQKRDVLSWLKWLAKRMSQSEHSQTIFLIEQMQVSWLADHHIDQQLYHVLVRLLLGSLVGVLSGLAVVPVWGWLGGLATWFMISMVLGTLVEIASKRPKGILWGFLPDRDKVERVQPIDRVSWSWERAIFGIVVGLVLGGIAAFLVPGENLVPGFGSDLSVRLVGGILSGGAFSIALGLLTGLTNSQVDETVKPNQGIRRSARHALRVALLTAVSISLPIFLGLVAFQQNISLVIVLFASLVGAIAFGIFVFLAVLLFWGTTLILGFQAYLIFLTGICLALSLGAYFGGLAAFQHFIIRILITYRQYAPWNYASFLEYASRRLILERVGGGYGFKHRLLQEHFLTLNLDDFAR